MAPTSVAHEAAAAPAGGPGSGKEAGQFKPGGNVNPLSAGLKPGEVFRRGPDHIARGSIKLLLGQIQFDKREAFYRNGCRIADGEAGPGPFLALLEMIGDRTEGRPVQHVHTTSKRTTVFERGAGAAGAKRDELGRVVETEQGTRSGPADETSPIDGRVLAEVGMGGHEEPRT